MFEKFEEYSDWFQQVNDIISNFIDKIKNQDFGKLKGFLN